MVAIAADGMVPLVVEEKSRGQAAVIRRVRVDIRPLDAADVGYARAKWRECHHRAPGKRRLPWSVYKLTFGEQIDRLLLREDVLMLGAYDDAGRVRGFVAWTPARNADAPWVHYAWVRPGNERQGLALRLLDAAELGRRWWYTFKGVKPKGGPPLDEVMVAALAVRGITATHLPANKFLGGAP